MGNLERFTTLGDKSGVETIWTCCVTCLAHLAALCHLVGQTESTSSGPMGRLCDLTLEKLANISLEVHIEQYSHFDVLTGVRIVAISLRKAKGLTVDGTQISWKRALDTIDARIGLRTDIESGSLRHWERVIRKVYADLQVGLSGYGPALLVSLALGTDGRSENSSFPNFMLQAERERHGL